MNRGQLNKMTVRINTPVDYYFQFTENNIQLPLNPILGKRMRLTFDGKITCIACQRLIKKTFNDGYCYPCFIGLAACDSCVMAPQRCHFSQGTCRQPEWGDKFCNQPHYVYLSNTSSEVKVGLTRTGQVPTRFIDQGAIAALPIFRTMTRHQAGVLEFALAQYASDRTKWQQMLKNEVKEIDLEEKREEILQLAEQDLDDFVFQFGEESLEILDKTPVINIQYPVLEYPQKIQTITFDKNPVIEGDLMGIKGQYLFLDGKVINIRKHTGYEVQIEM